MSTATQEHDQERNAIADARRWLSSGLAELTGFDDGPPLGPPLGFFGRLDALTDRLSVASESIGSRVVLDGPATLVERAQVMGLRRRGQISCGGATRLVRAADGWFAVSLARPDDVDLVPAWLGVAPGGPGADAWDAVHRRSGEMAVDEVIERGTLVGLPIAALPSGPGSIVDASPIGPMPLRQRSTVIRREPIRQRVFNRAVTRGAGVELRALDAKVVDLSSMWAGPLCAALLSEAGADVTKVELSGRPDGARNGPATLYERLNGTKHLLELDVRSTDGVRQLERLLRGADVVIESSRPRALWNLGIDAERLLADPDGPTVWVSITGHGRTGPEGERVAFGDDAAVGGGLVAWDGDRPCFCADAIADPLTGLVAAAAALEALAQGTPTLLDVAMVAVAAWFAGPTLPMSTAEA